MSVQVFYKNKAKSSGLGVIALFGNEKFEIKNLSASFSKNEASNIEKISDNMPPEEIQTIMYTVGKENGYEKNLRDWFKLIYQVMFGDIDGPRMGFFVSFFGVKETVKLIKDKIN